MASFKVIIIGSGLAGSLLANGLARHNIEFEVYERAEKHSKREGFQIRLGEGALIGMRACLEQEQIDSIARRFARSTVSNPPIVYDKHFNKMFEPGKMPGYQRSTPINRVSLREALSEPLYKMRKLHNEKRLTNYEIHRDGSRRFVKAFFDDDTSDTCDVLIGADGSGSKGISTMLGIGWRRDRMPQEFDALTTEEKWDAAELLIRDWSPQQGMGGNQSMLDTADALPLLTSLAEKAKTADGASEQDFIEACNAYEGTVIPRAFEWVRQSGGNDPLHGKTADTSKFKARAIMHLLSFIGEASTFWNWVVFKITGVDNSKQAIDLL
ncbi:hypothetical protein K4K54_012624 [Colletotrichum sp. SAR 10_86]|nr:hypothetical protein K4K51_002963 [Colletotrichum sp. SAR 10_75]KAI8196807.1 hypothetical protein KHU50_009941 [Colletotrichum sp. SAR 10_65]KAI8208921.1 hypothetical protein K4K52_000883 [Colletotrichum sp. SAR 10_76]KAI8231909.1 hypothetical protein K4K54_012624 [Colletotrichum sp. SAR 10_86]KAI8260612.1 hypothetical protein K4K53_001685 [Colletotrichum sp. SAR 10_77]KAJ5001745.1 hypothetical protein K4K48_000989 [Colletotrichum sp. SAR 10_66]